MTNKQAKKIILDSLCIKCSKLDYASTVGNVPYIRARFTTVETWCHMFQSGIRVKLKQCKYFEKENSLIIKERLNEIIDLDIKYLSV
jgi:hypothetical protein